jgi:SAM-dependent methyltransferase
MADTDATVETGKRAVRDAYEAVAPEYDERLAGRGPADARFVATEREFILDRVDRTDRVLDLGCGTGRLTIPIAGLGGEVVGMDFSPGMLDVARLRAVAGQVSVQFVEADMTRQFPFPEESFDVVVSTLALMHVPPPQRRDVFCSIARVLRPGGRALVGVKNSLFEALSAADRFAAVDVTDVVRKRLVFTGIEGPDDGREVDAPWYSFAPQDLTRLFALAGMTVVEMRGNIPLFAWVSDTMLREPGVHRAVSGLEDVLGSVPPFNFFGYHLLVEAIKPAGR